MDYYDIVLGLIPVTLGSVACGLFFWGMTPSIAIALASACSAGVVGHAMFVNSPVPDGSAASDVHPTTTDAVTAAVE
jgi:hypothetical protein